MKIELKHVTIKELTKDYKDKGEDGVVGYGGKLDVRPPFQREFVYKPEQRDAVISTVTKGYPLNVMYWAVREDGSYEIIDGQQRTISICQYVGGDFSVKIGGFPENRAFHNLKNEEKEQILNYELTVYLCEGTDVEKLKWFETINIAGEVLTNQELKNAVFSGSWVTAAKKYFSKNGCYAYNYGSDYLTGNCIRQDYLETTIKWKNYGDVDGYMSLHQNDDNAEELKDYFTKVIDWVESTFPVKRKKLMKGQDWGNYYNAYKDEKFDSDFFENKIKELILDDDVTNKKGIYPYLLTGKEKHLSIRSFTEAMKLKVYVKQGGKCKISGKELEITEMEADHITPWHEGGKTIEENCQMISKEENRKKSGK